MPQVWFAVTTIDGTRTDGVVQGASYSEALSTVSKHVSGNIGDVLEIGVEGFPPAKYRCIVAGKGQVEAWRPAGLLAA
jgi:hypothetical protein